MAASQGKNVMEPRQVRKGGEECVVEGAFGVAKKELLEVPSKERSSALSVRNRSL
jgi:hypothetical protein